MRDSLLGKEPHDWDIATNARPNETAALFERVIETGIDHGTVTVLDGTRAIEVTTYRADGAYTDGRRPESVRFLVSLADDLSRRDFTINAMAYDPIGDELVDIFGGARDLGGLVLRTVGNASERFREDSLRMLRAVRFAATLGLDMAFDTEEAIQADCLHVAPERIQVELVKGLLSERPGKFLVLLEQTDLLDEILPELAATRGCTQNKYHEFDVWRHTLHVMDATPADTTLRLAAMLHDVGKPPVKGVHPTTGEATFYDHETVGAEMADAILRRLKFSNEIRETVVHLIRHHLVPFNSMPSGSALRRWIRRVGPEHIYPLLELAAADAVGKGNAQVTGCGVEFLRELRERIVTMGNESPVVTRESQLAINGNDVMMALGIGPGPAVGAKLRELLEMVTDDPGMNSREALLGVLSP